MVPALTFSQSLAAQKSLASIFWSPASTSTIGPQLLVFSANEPRFLYSQQLSNTNRQTTDMTKNKHQTKEMLEQSTLNSMARCYGRGSIRTTENLAIIKEDTSNEIGNITEKKADYKFDAF
jgi:hypothetical protein